MRRRDFLRGGAGAAVMAATHPLYALGRTAPADRWGQRADEIRLYANENPYGPPPDALRAMEEALPYANRYGRYGTGGALIEPGELEAEIAEREGVPADHVLVSHGATELLQLSVAAHGEGGVVTSLPTYTTILGYAGAFGRSITPVPLRDDFHHDLPGLGQAVRGGAGLVYLCHPNNPTGLVEAQDEVERFCREAAGTAVVVADEAYHEFVDRPGYRSLAHLVGEGADVVVLRTFSKAYGMAGIRVGYAIGRPELVAPLRRLQTGPINVVSLIGARAGLRSQAFVEETRARISATRARLGEAFDARGLEWTDSVTNFLLVDVGRPARRVMADLRSRGVRVNSSMQRSSTRLRVTVGTDEEMEVFLEALDGAGVPP